MKKIHVFFIGILSSLLLFSSTVNLVAENASPKEELPMLDNPITVRYLKKNLRKSQPRLVLNSTQEKMLRKKIETDPVTSNLYQAIQLNSKTILEQPLLERIQIGRRLLSVSREMLYRMNMLGMTYRIEKDPKILNRIDQEITAVCNFTDWNPSHYLDVAEMAMAVAIGLDWTAGDLPSSTIELAEKALIEKGILPSWSENGKDPNWAYGVNNWNQVCNGGMIAASIAIAERDPELAAKTIYRALDGLPRSLASYMPDGVYPEGSTYWGYGTSFSVVTIAMLESAFGTDFGYGDYPGFKESAIFRLMCNAPSGRYFNFADCGDKRGAQGDATLAWFATKTGSKAFFEKDRFLQPAAELGKLSRLDGAALVWISQFHEKEDAILPTNWKGDGPNPIVIFTGGEKDSRHYYFGGKGGRGTVNHGNMDAGSFIFELDGVRWVIDPGNQDYNELEKTGFNLWSNCQDCERWTLLTKNNFGHSTLSVDEQLHVVNGLATIKSFNDGMNPSATIDLTPTFKGQLSSAERVFTKDSEYSLTIEDHIELLDSNNLITWQLITQADVEFTNYGVNLLQDGKILKVENLSHPALLFSVISLDPAPLKLDRQLKGLKRIELRVPAWTMKDMKGIIKIRLSGVQ